MSGGDLVQSTQIGMISKLPDFTRTVETAGRDQFSAAVYGAAGVGPKGFVFRRCLVVDPAVASVGHAVPLNGIQVLRAALCGTHKAVPHRHTNSAAVRTPEVLFMRTAEEINLATAYYLSALIAVQCVSACYEFRTGLRVHPYQGVAHLA